MVVYKDSMPVDRVDVTLETGFDGIEPVWIRFGNAGWRRVDVKTDSSWGRVDKYIELVKDSGFVIYEEAFVESYENGVRNIKVEFVVVASGLEAFNGEHGRDTLMIKYKGCVCAMPVNWQYRFVSIKYKNDSILIELDSHEKPYI